MGSKSAVTVCAKICSAKLWLARNHSLWWGNQKEYPHPVWEFSIYITLMCWLCQCHFLLLVMKLLAWTIHIILWLYCNIHDWWGIAVPSYDTNSVRVTVKANQLETAKLLQARRAAAAEARKQDSEAAEDTSESSTNPDEEANMYEDLFTAVMMATDQDNRPLHTVFQLLPSKKVREGVNTGILLWTCCPWLDTCSTSFYWVSEI